MSPGPERGDAARHLLDGRPAGGRQRVAEVVVAGQPATDPPGGGQQRGLAVEPHHRSVQPGEPVGGRLDFVRGGLDPRAEPALIRIHEPSG
jgi:hypothetical protein